MRKIPLLLVRLRAVVAAIVGAASLVAAGAALAPSASASAQPSLIPAAGQFSSVPLQRVLDTRTGLGELAAQPLGAGITINIAVTGSDGVPSSATAVVAEIHAANPGADGYLSDNSTDAPDLAAPAIGLRAGIDTDQTQTIAVGSDGDIYVTNHSSASTDLTVSVVGYFTGSAADSAGDTYFDAGWIKIVDTETGLGTSQAPIPAGGSITVQVGGQGGIATGADTAVVQLTGLNATTSGWLTAYAAGSGDPDFRILSYDSGLSYQNLVYVPLSSSGQMTITNHGAEPVDVHVVTRGYFMPPSTTPAAAAYTVIEPTTIYGTPGTGTSLAGNSSVTFQVGGQGGIPSAALSELAEDVVVLSPTASGSIDVYRGGGTDPNQPALSFLAGDNTDVAAANQIVSQVSPTGQETITNKSSGTLNIQVVARGYYLAPSVPQAPASITATISGSSAMVSWAAPASDGGSPITSYRVTASPDSGPITTDPGTSQVTLTGLSHPASDSFTVTAVNAIGTSPASTWQPVSPASTVENTLTSGSPIAAGTTVDFAVGGQAGLPTYGVGEAGLQVAISDETASGSASLTPSGFTSPAPSVSFSASTPKSSLVFVPAGSQGQISLTNSSTGTIDVVVNLTSWSNASAVVPADQQASFISSAEADGTSADDANQAAFNEALALGIATSVISTTPDDVGEVVTPTDTLTVTDSISGTETGYVDSPGIPVSYSSGSFDTTAIPSCPSGSRMNEHTGNIAGYNFLNRKLFTTHFHKIWCFNGDPNKVPGSGTKVTAIIKISVYPSLTKTGAIAGWTFKGVDSKDDYYFNATGSNTHSGEHSWREAHWILCAPLHVACGDNTFVKENMNVFWNGTWQFWRGKDNTYP